MQILTCDGCGEPIKHPVSFRTRTGDVQKFYIPGGEGEPCFEDICPGCLAFIRQALRERKARAVAHAA
jgi:hypothetical protein